jgi:hypothetical protein
VRAATLSVIVRLWSEDGAEPLLRGEAEHVRTGERCAFRTYGRLVAVLEQWRQEGADAPA